MANRRASEDEIAKMLRAKRRKAGVTQSGAASKKGNADPAKARQADAAAKDKSRVNPTGKGSRLSEEERLARRTDPSNPNFGRSEGLDDFDSQSVFRSGDSDTERTDVTKKGTKEAKAQATKKDERAKALEDASNARATYSPTAQKGESNLAEDIQGGFSKDSGPSVSGGSGIIRDYDDRQERDVRAGDQKIADDTLKYWLQQNPDKVLPAFKSKESVKEWARNVRIGRDVIGNGGAVSAEKKGEVRDRAVARERTVRSQEFLATTQRRTVPSANPLSPSRVIPPSNPLTVADAKARQEYLTGEPAKGAGAPMRSVVEQQPDGTFSVVPRPIPNRVTVQSLYSTKVKPAVREAKEAEQALATAEGLQKLDAYAQSPEAPRVTAARSDAEIARLTEARLGNEEGMLDTENKRYVVDQDIGRTYPRTMTTREAMRSSGNPLTEAERKSAFGVGPGRSSTSGILDIGGDTKISSQFRGAVAAKRAAADALTDKENPPKWGPDDERLTFEGVPTKDVTTKEGQAAIIEATSKFKPKTEVGIGSKKLGVTSGATPSLGEMENEEGISDILALKDVPGSNKTEQLRNYIADYTRDPKTGAISKLPKSRHPDQQNQMYAQLVRNTAGIKGGSNADAYQKGEQVAGEKPVWAGDELDTVVQNPLGFGESLRENRNTYWGEQAETNKRAAKAAGGNIQNQSAAKAALTFSINEKTNSILEKLMMPGEGNTAGVAAGHLRAAIDPSRRPDSSYRLDSTGAAYVPDTAGAKDAVGYQGPTMAGMIQRAEDLDQTAAGAELEHGKGSTPHRTALRQAKSARRFAESFDRMPGSRGGMTAVMPGGGYSTTPEGVAYEATPGSSFEGQSQAQREQTRQAMMSGTFQRPPSSTTAEPFFEPSSAPRQVPRISMFSDDAGNLSVGPTSEEVKTKPKATPKPGKIVDATKNKSAERKAFKAMEAKQMAEHAAKVAKAQALGGTGSDVNFKGDVPAGTPSPRSDAAKLAGSSSVRGPQSLHLQAGYQSDYGTSSYESNPMPLPMPGRSSPAAKGQVLAVGGRNAGVMVPPTSVIWGESTGGDPITGNGAVRRSTGVYGSPDKPQSKSEYQADLDRRTFDQLEYSKPGPTGIRGSMRGGSAIGGGMSGTQYSRPIPAPPGYAASFGERPGFSGNREAKQRSAEEVAALRKQGRVSSAMGGGQFNQ